VLSGPVPWLFGKSQRGLRCAFYISRKPSWTGLGSGTRRSLLPLPRIRKSPLTLSMAVTSSVAASLIRRPQA